MFYNLEYLFRVICIISVFCHTKRFFMNVKFIGVLMWLQYNLDYYEYLNKDNNFLNQLLFKSMKYFKELNS